MARRVFVIALAFVLCVMLCGFHSCEGEECVYCALVRELRRASVFVLFALSFGFILLSFVVSRGASSECEKITFTLVGSKVKLTD